MLHLREQAEEIHAHPFGRQHESSELTGYTSGSSGEKSALSKIGFLRRHSRQSTPETEHHRKGSRTFGIHARKASAAAGNRTVTVHSEPETFTNSSNSDLKQQEAGSPRTHPVHFVDVKTEVEQQVIGMSEREKEYSAYILYGGSRASEDGHDRKTRMDEEDEEFQK